MWIEREETILGKPEDVFSYIQQIEKKYEIVSHDIERFTSSVFPEVEATIRYGVQFDKKVNITWEERS